MNNEFVFLRHALTKIDSTIRAEQWELSEEGKKNIREIVQRGTFDDINVIISSAEKKAYHTAAFIAFRLNKEVTEISDFNELKRGYYYISSKEEYEKKVEKVFLNKDESIEGWESAKITLRRFLHALDYLNFHYSNKRILVVCHGINLSLYFADLMQIPDEQIFSRWKKLEFCAWGIVKDNRVIKDIISAKK